MRHLKSQADSEEDKINKATTDVQRNLDALQQAMFQSDDTSASASVLKSAFLPDGLISQMQEQSERDGQTDFFKSLRDSLKLQHSAAQSYSAHQSGEKLDDALLFGDGNQAPVLSLSSFVSEALLLQQATKMKELSHKVEQMEGLLSKFTDHQTQSKDVGPNDLDLADEVRAMRDKNTFLLQEVDTLRGTVQKLSTDQTDILKQSSRMLSYISALQKDVKDIAA
jgi:hypothetical protein